MNRRRLVHPIFFLLLAAAALSVSARGQETLTTRDGKTQQVRIFGVDQTGVKVQLGAATMSIPMGNVASVSMASPPTYQAALAAYQTHDLNTALANAKAVVQQFGGLPVDWAESAMTLIGDIYVDQNQLPLAAQAYAAFQKAYPGAGSARLNVGLARIDVARKDYDAANKKIHDIVSEAMKAWNPPQSASATLGQAYLVSAEVKEAQGDFQGALQDYLRTVTVFSGDRVAVVDAQQRADALRKAHDVSVP